MCYAQDIPVWPKNLEGHNFVHLWSKVMRINLFLFHIKKKKKHILMFSFPTPMGHLSLSHRLSYHSKYVGQQKSLLQAGRTVWSHALWWQFHHRCKSFRKASERVPRQLPSKRKYARAQSSPAETRRCVLACCSQIVPCLPTALAPFQGKAAVSHGAQLPRGDVPKSVRKVKITSGQNFP